jgi:1-acyl-sn-glycerol-3-phosphate acyltransferase
MQQESEMQNIFSVIYRFFHKHPLVFYLIFFVSLGTSIFFALQVRFEEDIASILPKDEKVQKLTRVFTNSKFADRLVITISLKDSNAIPSPDTLVAYAENFVTRVQNELDPYINSIQDRVDDEKSLQLIEVVNENLPVYLEEKDYAVIDTLILPETIRNTLQRNIRTLTSPAGLALKTMITRDPVGIGALGLRKMQGLQYDDNFELYDNYIVSKDHKHLLLFITPAFPPSNTGKNDFLLKGLNRIIDSLAGTSFENVDASYFGGVAVSVGNALQLRKDSLYTQGFTILFIILFLGFYFRKKRAPFIILIPVIFGIFFSLAAIYFIQGSISVIALGTGSIVLGIAVNYSLHVFNHFRHTGSMENVLQDLSKPLTIGSFTTVGGFICLQFVESEMLKDLGLFAAFSLIGASLSSLVFLPQFISAKSNTKHAAAKTVTWIDRLSFYRPEYNKLLISIIILLTILFAFTAGNVKFEPDMSKMNYMPDPLKLSEAKLNRVHAYALQSVYLVTEGLNLDEALRKNENLAEKMNVLQQKGNVTKYSGVSSVIISDSMQQQRIARWNSYWTETKKRKLLATLKEEGAKLKFKPSAFDQFIETLQRKYSTVDTSQLNAIRRNFLDDYITEMAGGVTVVTLAKVLPHNKDTLYKSFDNQHEVTVVDRQYLTGRFVQIINDDFSKIAWMSAILVFSVLLITYGRIELALVSFVPMLITWIWILGIMGLAGISFNIINIIISALIFGLGDDYSLFITDGMVQEYKTGKKNLSSYKSSIFLSAITTIAGLGVLIFAQHPALRSIALVSIIGIACVAIISQVMIPFLFNLLITNRVKRKLVPFTLMNLLISVFAFSYFIVISFFLTIFGFIILKVNPFFKDQSKHLFHILLSAFNRSVVYIMFNFKKNIINEHGEDFKKPAVWIVNHQSFIDTLHIMMLHPKLILFTNDWVYHSKMFGIVVRLAGYYPVSMGADESVERLEVLVSKGYSIAIFPEGTRSPDGEIRRFHKGAFFLAEKFQLDLLPVLLHGTRMAMAKGDFILKNAATTIKILPRIGPGDMRYGSGYGERAKLVARYFRTEYESLRRNIETPSYFREQLIYNYIYKGPVLEWYLKIKSKLEGSYEIFDKLIPRKATILDIGCGYGFMSYMLHFVSADRNITGIDYDEEKIDTANRCFLKNERINFFSADALAFPFQHYDAIVIADMLHYLQPAEQKELIQKCFAHINPGGLIVIRDGNKDMQDRHKGTRLTEFFSTKLIKFNKTGAHELSFLSGKFVRELANAHNFSCDEIDNSRFTSNVIFILKHKP